MKKWMCSIVISAMTCSGLAQAQSTLQAQSTVRSRPAAADKKSQTSSLAATPDKRVDATQTVAKSGRFAVMTVGVDYRAERDQEQSSLPRAWPSFSLGYGIQPWLLSLEYAKFTESSGNSTLSVDRKAETLILWGQWFADEPWTVLPYMALGLGAYRSSADLNLYTDHTSAQGKLIEHAAAAFGLKLTNVSPFWLSLEGRVHMNRELDPSPTVSAMFRLGFVID